jgi:hypothetical protein
MFVSLAGFSSFHEVVSAVYYHAVPQLRTDCDQRVYRWTEEEEERPVRGPEYHAPPTHSHGLYPILKLIDL